MAMTRTKGSELVIALVVVSLALLWRRPSLKSIAAADALPRSVKIAPVAERNLKPTLARTTATISTPAAPFAARDAGYATIATLERQGEYANAAQFALTSTAAIRRDLIIAAFVGWGTHAPDAALAQAIAVPDPAARRLAYESLLTGWARTDPAELAHTAVHFPAGPERDTALTKALREWMHRDPWTAGDWLLAQGRDVQDLAERMFETENR